MVERLTAWWHHPLAFRYQLTDILRYAAVFTFYVTFFLGFYQPFFLAQLDPQDRWVIAGIIGSFTGLTILTGHLLARRYARNWRNRWTLGSELLWSLLHFTIIAVFNLVVVRLLTSLDIKAWVLLGETACVGIIPVVIDLVRRLRTDQVFEERPRLLYVKSDGNYVHIYRFRAHQVEREIVRIPLYKFKSVHAEDLVQVHKRYLVNSRAVIDVQGNSNGGRIVLDDGLHVPYSRGFYADVRSIAS